MTTQQTEKTAPHKTKQQYIVLGLLALLGIFLLLIGGKNDSVAQPRAQTTMDVARYTSDAADPIAAMEQKLAETLSRIQGAGAVSVQITAKSTGRKEFAVDVQRTDRTTTEENDTATQQTTEMQEQRTIVQQNQNGMQQALLLEELSPEITGVLIVASGAHSAVVQERLLHAASVALQLSIHQIIVMPGEEVAS